MHTIHFYLFCKSLEYTEIEILCESSSEMENLFKDNNEMQNKILQLAKKIEIQIIVTHSYCLLTK